MIIAVDKDSKQAIARDNNEYIYLFDNEPYQELLNSNLHCLKYKYCKFVDINLTDYDIDCIKKSKITEKDCKKIEYKNHKIAIIVPNYNYAECLERCFNSILEQTYTNYEIIFVDDMSEDNSLEVARAILKPPHKIIPLKQKRLNGGARNEAYLHISDDVDYIWYVDSDDWLSDKYALENINKKLQNKPDVLFVSINQCKNGVISLAREINYKDKYEAIEGWSGSCGKVIKKELAISPECLYCEGTLMEDRNQHRKICIYMNSFECLKTPVYVWNKDNNKSVTTIRDEAKWGSSVIRHYADTLQLYLTVKGKDKKIDNILYDKVKQTRKEMLEKGDKQW